MVLLMHFHLKFTSCLTSWQSYLKDFLIQLHLKLSSLTFNRESAYILLRESMACRNAENTALHGAVGTATRLANHSIQFN